MSVTIAFLDILTCALHWLLVLRFVLISHFPLLVYIHCSLLTARCSLPSGEAQLRAASAAGRPKEVNRLLWLGTDVHARDAVGACV